MSTENISTEAAQDSAITAAILEERERANALAAIAAGLGTPEADLIAAITAGLSVEAFSLAEAPKAIARRMAAQAGMGAMNGAHHDGVEA